MVDISSSFVAKSIGYCFGSIIIEFYVESHVDSDIHIIFSLTIREFQNWCSLRFRSAVAGMGNFVEHNTIYVIWIDTNTSLESASHPSLLCRDAIGISSLSCCNHMRRLIFHMRCVIFYVHWTFPMHVVFPKPFVILLWLFLLLPLAALPFYFAFPIIFMRKCIIPIICPDLEPRIFATGGKPSTWLPPGDS